LRRLEAGLGFVHPRDFRGLKADFRAFKGNVHFHAQSKCETADFPRIFNESAPKIKASEK
jgi:hypothetical protein